MLDSRRTPTAIINIASNSLEAWASQQKSSFAERPSLGPVILATLLAETRIESALNAAKLALSAWLATAVRRAQRIALHGGQAEVLAGLRLIADLHPRIIQVAVKVEEQLDIQIAESIQRSGQVCFEDYDLFSGLAGVLLADQVGNRPSQRKQLVVRHLTGLADPKLSGLRVSAYENDEMWGWMQDGINTGLAHGVSGVLAALALAADSDEQKIRAAIRHIAEWLISEAFVDERGIFSWSSRGREGQPPPGGVVRRQAYCYGNPGVAWSLWVGGEVLGSAEIRSFALAAARSYCINYDFDMYLYGRDIDQLGLCHGAAGTLLISDAFARHANLAEAAELREKLMNFLYDKAENITAIGEENSSLLMGAPGIFAALLTAGGYSRSWLPCLGLK